MRVTVSRENGNWVDTGCEVAPLCLECPLPECKYDVPGGIVHIEQQGRAARALELRGQGAGIEAIRAELGVSRRAVFRYLAEGVTGGGGCATGDRRTMGENEELLAMVEAATVSCSRCAAKVHAQKDHCHNCGLPLTPADTTKPPLRGRPAPGPRGG